VIETIKRPIESDFTSHVAYTRALEEYCDSLESQEPDIYPEEAYEMGLEAIAYYTHPPQRTWVGLTKEDKDLVEDLCEMMIGDAAFSTIDAILKGKNT
jgi:hypothetical protein